ncbi:hypothetical protein CAPTEDRAFT_175809 [Capitella teleta]|uniref:UDP-xylose and UDP-N-acetylglucosamine transporter n=1 Tax=Capitella teleta TaxID=283909 RepID=R7UZV3_CAPTE|nr:hypothetical protein CAPTEDRAFT_175809 [Capitella teleta]|eukprot:ELU12113.1 hypothetical protein CAPTEDRAFT_175809 [Capitella teleta]
MHPAIPIALVFIGCCSNVVFLELLVKEDPGAGNIVTFAQFLFISIEGFFFTVKCGTKAPSIPISTYVVMVALFFVVNVVNNQALNFNIAMPLHMIFRAGSLMANLVLGVFILNRRYTLSKYLSVLVITLGIAMSTIASAGRVVSDHSICKNNDDIDEQGDGFSEMIRWLIGIAMLTFALFMSARMGIYQETVYAKFGKHPSEALFYNHALPLPGFILLAKDIYDHGVAFSSSAPMLIPVIGITAPKMWIYLIGNIITQYVCIRSVFILTTECTSLTVTLVVTLRKFISLIFSIIYFRNPFTVYHWIGTAFVFGGTFVFTGVVDKLRQVFAPTIKPVSKTD